MLVPVLGAEATSTSIRKEGRLNTSQNLKVDNWVPENLTERELPKFIRNLCEQAYDQITLGSVQQSVEKMQKAEQLLLKHAMGNNTAEFELLFFIYNNMTVASYNQSLIEEAQSYAEKSLKNFEYLKSIRKPNRPYNFQFFSDQNEYVLHCKKKILAKKFICRTHLQLSIIFSETLKNLDALDHAKKAVKAACNILIDTLILFYYYLYKAQIRPNEGKRDLKSLSFYGYEKTQNSYDFWPSEEHSRRKKTDNHSMSQFSSSDIYDDASSSGNESRDGSFNRSNLPETSFTNRYEELAHKYIPILEEIVEKIKPRKFATYRSRRDRLLAYYRHYFEHINWSAPDLTNLYGGINQSHWVNTTNLLSVMKLGAVSPTKISFEHPKLESELEIDSMIEKITLIATGFYTISTETRFSKEKGSMTPSPKPHPVKFLESEIWLSKSVEVGYLFLPHTIPLMSQIFTVYTRFYGISNQMIPEEEDELHGLMYLKPLKDKYDEKIVTEIFNIQGPFLHEKTAPEFESIETRQSIPAESLTLQDQITDAIPADTQAEIKETGIRSRSSGNRPESAKISSENNRTQIGNPQLQLLEAKRNLLQKTYLNARPNSMGKSRKHPSVIRNTNQDAFSEKGIRFADLTLNQNAFKKINNYFSNGTFIFEKPDGFDSSQNSGAATHNQETINESEPEISEIERIERSLLNSKNLASNPAGIKTKQFTSFTSELERGFGNMKPSRPNGSNKGKDSSAARLIQHQNSFSSTRHRKNTPGANQKDYSRVRASTPIKSGANDENTHKKRPRVPSANPHNKSFSENPRQAFSSKFDIKINNNINFFINPSNIDELGLQITGSRSQKSKRGQQTKNNSNRKSDSFQQSSVDMSQHGITDRVRPRSNIQRRVETDPDHSGSISEEFQNYTPSFLKENSQRSKSPLLRDRPPVGPRMNLSAAKRGQMSFTKESDKDRSDSFARSGTEQNNSKIQRNHSTSAERNPESTHVSKGKQLSELEKILKAARPKASMSRGDYVKPPSRKGDKAPVQTQQPYLNSFNATTNMNPVQSQYRKLNDILPRDQLSKSINRIRTKYNQESFDQGAGFNELNNQNEGISIFDQMKANPKIFRTYDK